MMNLKHKLTFLFIRNFNINNNNNNNNNNSNHNDFLIFKKYFLKLKKWEKFLMQFLKYNI